MRGGHGLQDFGALARAHVLHVLLLARLATSIGAPWSEKGMNYLIMETLQSLQLSNV